MTAFLDRLGIDAADAVALLAAMTVFCLVLLAFSVIGRRMALGARLRVAAGREAPKRAPERSRKEAMGLLRALLERGRLMRSRQTEAVRLKLARAGWRSADALTIYMAAKLLLPFVAGGLAALVLYGPSPWALGGAHKAMVVIACALAGSWLPEILIRNAAQRRRDAIRSAMPDALDLMVICAEAGLSLDPSVDRIAREMAATAPVLADELRMTASELRFLPERRKAWENLAQRADLAPVRALTNTLAQTERYGTSLAHAVRVLAQEQRNERMMRAEEKAARLPAIMTIPLIVLILPALFIILLGPAVIDIMEVLSTL